MRQRVSMPLRHLGWGGVCWMHDDDMSTDGLSVPGNRSLENLVEDDLSDKFNEEEKRWR